MIGIRAATIADAEVISGVLIASITELRVADHGGRPDDLAAWLTHKDPVAVGAMLGDPRQRVLVAEIDGAVAAVGAVEPAERLVALNYVSPRHRFAGVSSTLLGALEAALGAGEAHLSSTATARGFYRARGWTETGEIVTWRGLTAYPMRKQLS